MINENNKSANERARHISEALQERDKYLAEFNKWQQKFTEKIQEANNAREKQK